MFQYFFRISFVLFLLCIVLNAQKKYDYKDLRSKFAKKGNRVKFEKELYKFIDTSLSKPLSGNNIKQWQKAFGDASLYFIKNDTVKNSLDYILKNYKIVNNKLLYRAIQTAYNLYPGKFKTEIEIIFQDSEKPSVFSAAAIYLLNYESKEKLQTVLRNKFKDFSSDPVLKMLDYYLRDDIIDTPLLQDLLSHNFQNNKTIVYSFQRKDRNYPGLTIIKSPEGSFIRNEDGSIFYIQHLALSASNFPGFLKNGNTPQGIYSIQKFYYTPTEEIGPSPILLSRIPFEIEAKKFYHGEIKINKWNIEDYKNLLPVSWKDFFPVYESYYAGLAGRKVIVAHGSSDDPKFYKDKIYSPLAPTKGCLSAKEIWNDKGRLVESDQVKLMKAFFSTNQLYGFLVVVEINDKKEPVTIEELLPAIQNVERLAVKK